MFAIEDLKQMGKSARQREKLFSHRPCCFHGTPDLLKNIEDLVETWDGHQMKTGKNCVVY